MCGMNLAFNRDLIGPAMYFGLMGEGPPIGRWGGGGGGPPPRAPLPPSSKFPQSTLTT
jgi:hypothetical protein